MQYFCRSAGCEWRKAEARTAVPLRYPNVHLVADFDPRDLLSDVRRYAGTVVSDFVREPLKISMCGDERGIEGLVLDCECELEHPPPPVSRRSD